MTVSGNASRWKDLPLRLASIAVVAPITAYCVKAGGMSFKMLLAVITFGLAYEAISLVGLRWRVPAQRWRLILVLCWPLASLAAGFNGAWGPALMIVMTGLLFGPAQWLCIVAASLGSLSLLYLRGLPTFGLVVVVYLLVVVIACDSAAYTVGRLMGGKKLAPSISPGKTRSGAVGGLLGAALAGVGVVWLVQRGPSGGALFWAILLGLASQCGDLLESAFKRRVGVKDSGRLLPGHGGLLDRLDGLILAAPLAAALSLCVQGTPFWMADSGDVMAGMLDFFRSPLNFFVR